MRNIFIAFRSFSLKGSRSIRIISLSIGLTVGLVLIAKIYFEQSYNNFFPDKEHIYLITANHETAESAKPSDQISRGVSVGAKDEIPEIVVATRFTGIAHDDVFATADKNKYRGTFILGDTYLFDIFPRNILAGDVKDVLSRPMHVMISSELADKMGGIDKAIGQSFQIESEVGHTFIVGGVFESLPTNTHLNYDAVVAMPSISQLRADYSEDWVGNERFTTYIKVVPQADINAVISTLNEVYQKNTNHREQSTKLSLIPLLEIHTGSNNVKQVILLLSLLAFTLLLTTVVNYTLIVISSLVNRSKEMAIHKCHGASPKDIYTKILSETFVDFLFALLVTFMLVLLSKDIIFSLLGTSLSDLFSWASALLLSFVCIMVFLSSGLAPGYLYARIPVSVVFSRFRENKRFWKLALLFAQFAIAGLFVSLLAVIGRQYNYMINYNTGYNYENLVYCNLSGINAELRRKAYDEVSRLPGVKQVTTSDDLLFDRYKENKVYLSEDIANTLYAADLYEVGNGFLQQMEIPVLEGRSFRENENVPDEVMVSRAFAEKAKNLAGWEGSIVGKNIRVEGHSSELFTICGIYEELHLGTIGEKPSAASIMFHSDQASHNLLIRFYNQTPEAIREVSDLLTGLFPDKEITVSSYSQEMVGKYAESRKFRDSTLLGGIVALAICLIGLIGYTTDEMNRRRKETAIRKINGATISDILLVFITDILLVIFPALIIGGITAYFISERWLTGFSEKINLSFILFLLCGLFISGIILGTVSLSAYRFATANPAESLKNND